LAVKCWRATELERTETMDQTLETMTDFVVSLNYDDLPASVIEKTTSIIVDTLACALGGSDCRAAQISPSFPAAAVEDRGGRVIGQSAGFPPDLAAFWNTSMIRYLDWNDTLVAGHASDMIGAIAAASGRPGISGPDVLTATVVSYEIHARIAELMQHWPTIDRVYWAAVGAAGGLCNMLGLSREATRNALSMAATSGLALRATRAGQLSDYKGVSSAINPRRAVFLVFFAEAGLTGPSAPFDGRHGLGELIDGDEHPLDLDDFTEWKVMKTWQKSFPVAYNIQPTVWAALQLRSEMPPDQVADVVLNVAPLAWAVSGNEAEKWDPQTRQTADHSLPYAFAHAFLTGELDHNSFDRESIRNPDTLAFMKQIRVVPDPEIGPDIPSVVGVRAEISDTAGKSHQVSVMHPRGHDQNPMSREDITSKARKLIEPHLRDRTDSALEIAWQTPHEESFTSVLDAFRIS
jgi:2-methylcitrate dehydratase